MSTETRKQFTPEHLAARRRGLRWFAAIVLSLSMIREVVALTVDGTHGLALATSIVLLLGGSGALASLLGALFPAATPKPREGQQR